MKFKPTKKMDRYMTMSALAAAAIHGGVLLGWPRGDVPERIPAEVIRWEPFVPPRIEPEPDPVLEITESSRPKGNLDGLRPTLDETLVPVTSLDFTVPVIPQPPTNVRTEKISDVIGIPHGNDVPVRPTIITPGMLDSTPRTRAQPAPIYPFEKRRTGERGEATVEFTVDESGRVIEPRVTHASDRAFESAALQAIAKWRFEPGRRLGRVVRFRMVQTFTFTLNEG